MFGENQLRQMERSQRDVYVALVGGSRDVADSRRGCVCLLDPEQIADLLDLSSTSQQALTVNLTPRRQLRVYRGRKERFIVPPEQA